MDGVTEGPARPPQQPPAIDTFDALCASRAWLWWAKERGAMCDSTLADVDRLIAEYRPSCAPEWSRPSTPAVAACRAAGAATPPQQQPECEAQTWEEFIDWYRPVTFRDGRPEWSPAIERHMRAAWDHQQKTINALDTISHAKGAELERVASLVGYAGAKPGGLRDAVADALAAGAGAATPPAESLRDDWPAPLDPSAAAYTLTAKEVAAINRAGEMLRGGAGAATPASTPAAAPTSDERYVVYRGIKALKETGNEPHAEALRDLVNRLTAGGVAAAPSPATPAQEKP
jgi:hypothetical protein